MERPALWIVVGIICLCLTMVSISQAQQAGSKEKASAAALPAELCKAILKYLGNADSARSIREQTKRQMAYAKAQEELAPVLNRHNAAARMADAAEYARCTEQVVVADSRDPKFDELVDKRLKLRAVLLAGCETHLD